MPDTPAIPPQPLVDTDGKVFAYLVPAADLDRLRAEVETLRRQKDRYVSLLDRMLKASAPEPPTRDEMERAAANDNSAAIDAIIAGLPPR